LVIVTEDFVGTASVQDRILRASFADSAEFVARAWTSGLSALPRQALAQGVEYSFSQGFAGRGGELARQSVGLRVFDA
jgi:hypothetical protein